MSDNESSLKKELSNFKTLDRFSIVTPLFLTLPKSPFLSLSLLCLVRLPLSFNLIFQLQSVQFKRQLCWYHHNKCAYSAWEREKERGRGKGREEWPEERVSYLRVDFRPATRRWDEPKTREHSPVKRITITAKHVKCDEYRQSKWFLLGVSKRRSEAHLECPVQWASPLCLLSSNPLSPPWHRVESCRHPERASDTFSLFDKMKFYGARDEDEENCRRQDNNASRGQKLKQSGYEFSVSTKTMPGQERRRVRVRERERGRDEGDSERCLVPCAV